MSHLYCPISHYFLTSIAPTKIVVLTSILKNHMVDSPLLSKLTFFFFTYIVLTQLLSHLYCPAHIVLNLLLFQLTLFLSPPLSSPHCYIYHIYCHSSHCCLTSFVTSHIIVSHLSIVSHHTMLSYNTSTVNVVSPLLSQPTLLSKRTLFTPWKVTADW